jgi:hypothetical protein
MPQPEAAARCLPDVRDLPAAAGHYAGLITARVREAV